MNEITENEARKILLEARSPAANLELYRADREGSGWVFRWADRSKRMPVGAHAWVVADSGKAARVRLGEIPDEALQRLAD